MENKNQNMTYGTEPLRNSNRGNDREEHKNGIVFSDIHDEYVNIYVVIFLGPNEIINIQVDISHSSTCWPYIRMPHLSLPSCLQH